MNQHTKQCSVWESAPAHLAVLLDENYSHHWLDTEKQHKLNWGRQEATISFPDWDDDTGGKGETVRFDRNVHLMSKMRVQASIISLPPFSWKTVCFCRERRVEEINVTYY